MEKGASETAADVLEKARELYPEDGFIIIAIKKVKHPDNGDDRSSVALASNLDGRGEIFYWLGDVAIQIAADREQLQRREYKKP